MLIFSVEPDSVSSVSVEPGLQSVKVSWPVPSSTGVHLYVINTYNTSGSCVSSVFVYDPRNAVSDTEVCCV